MQTAKGHLTAHRTKPGFIAFGILQGHNFLDVVLTDDQAEAFQFEIIQALTERRRDRGDALREAVFAGAARDD